MTKIDPHFHLTVLGSAKLKIKVLTNLRGHSVHSWLRSHDLKIAPKKIENPSDWRISYGVLRRFASALGTTTDKLYREIAS